MLSGGSGSAVRCSTALTHPLTQIWLADSSPLEVWVLAVGGVQVQCRPRGQDGVERLAVSRGLLTCCRKDILVSPGPSGRPGLYTPQVRLVVLLLSHTPPSLDRKLMSLYRKLHNLYRKLRNFYRKLINLNRKCCYCFSFTQNF